MRLTIATWNIHGNRAAWSYLARRGVDIALVQEAKPPAIPLRTFPSAASPDEWRIGKGRPWASAIGLLNDRFHVERIPIRPLPDAYSEPWEPETIYASHPRTFVGAKLISTNGGEALIISAYGLMTDWNASIHAGYSSTSLHRLLSDLTPWLDSPRGQNAVLAGDLNSGDQWKQGTRYARWGPMHDVVRDRIESFGFVNAVARSVPSNRGPLQDCPCGMRDDCRHVRTFRLHGKPDSAPYQGDHVFVRGALVGALVDCQPDYSAEAWSLSDHCPLIAEFDI